MKASIKAKQLVWVFNFVSVKHTVLVKAWSPCRFSWINRPKMDKEQEENTKSSSSSSSSSSLSSSCHDEKSKGSAQSAKMSQCSDSNLSERSVSAASQSKSKQPKKVVVPNKKKGKHNLGIIQWPCGLQVSLPSCLPACLQAVLGSGLGLACHSHQSARSLDLPPRQPGRTEILKMRIPRGLRVTNCRSSI